MTNATTRRRRPGAAAALLIGTGLVLGLLGTVRSGAATPTSPRPTAEATAALDWLAGQITSHGGALPGPVAGTPDWGLTADAVLAFASAGRSTDPAAVAATDQLVAHAADFTTYTSVGVTVRVAGPTAKVLLVALSTGRSATVGGVDLDAALRGLMRSSGPQTGRFADGAPDPTWDGSNGFGQSLAMLALARTDRGVPAPAVEFLLAQQCPAGGFRLNYGTAAGCGTDAEADSDATAVSLQALLAVERSPDVLAALERGTAWLRSRQGAEGSFGGTGPTAAPNANSTGMIAQFLRAAGDTTAADRAAGWIAACCQLSAQNATGTPASGHIGAIGYDPAARTSALADGIGAGVSDQWRRTTTQAVLAFGLAPYGPPVEPLPPTGPTTSAPGSSSTIPTTSPSSTTPSSTTPSDTTPSNTAPSSTVAGVELGPATQATAPVSVQSEQLDAEAAAAGTSPTSGSVQGSSLARTGTDSRWLLTAALVLLGSGAALATAERREGG
ncbi:MAG TPA: terpene cyclase/mutase family protein [Microthrixaceae bacterium]|nr:terpene cyclase/mutase family protein [Microthrixaceae bacterium]